MKKTLLVLILPLILFMASCSGSDDDSASTTIVQSKIYGWWYANDNTEEISYKAYYFGEDGTYKQDMSNFGLGEGLGTYVWSGDAEITMTPTPGGGIAGGVVVAEVFKLTNDSLVFATEELRLSKNNPNN